MSTGIDGLEKGVLGSLLLADTLRRLADDEGIRVVKEGVSEMPQEAKLEFSDFSPQIRTQALKMQAVYVQFFCLENAVRVRIPVKWASDSGDVGRSRSEATLVVFYVSKVDHMRSRKA